MPNGGSMYVDDLASTAEVCAVFECALRFVHSSLEYQIALMVKQGLAEDVWGKTKRLSDGIGRILDVRDRTEDTRTFPARKYKEALVYLGAEKEAEPKTRETYPAPPLWEMSGGGQSGAVSQ